MAKICTCLGGSNITFDNSFREKARQVVFQSIASGYTKFICSGYGNWSLFLASIFREIQKEGVDVCIICYIADLLNAKQFKEELLQTALYDEICILPGKNIVETDLYLIKKAQRIFMAQGTKIRNKSILDAIEHLRKEAVWI